MRYRPFQAAGRSASAISLAPSADLKPADREAVLQAGLLAGVNSFEVSAEDAEGQRALGAALADYDRDILLISLRLELGADAGGPQALIDRTQAAIAAIGRGAPDVLMLGGLEIESLTPPLVEVLQQAHAAGLFGSVGVRAEGARAEALVRCGAFKVLATRFNLRSGWPERNLIRSAIEGGMTVVGYGFVGGELQAEGAPAPKPKRGFLGLGRQKAAGSELAQETGYSFLHNTNGWSEAGICLAYALTEPALATVQVEPRSVEELHALAAAPERDLPSSVAAQIEMARFSKVA